MADSRDTTGAPEAPLDLAALWAEAEPILYTNGLPDEVVERAFAAETQVLAGEISTPADAVAKLKVLDRSFSIGERRDELDRAALVQVIRWLEAG